MAMKLHELIAVLGDAQTTAAKINGEAMKTFGRPELFTRTIKDETFLSAEDSEALAKTEELSMETTVADKLAYLVRPNVRYLDTYLTKEAANQQAKGDIEIEGVVLAAGVPVTVLLGLETKLSELRRVYETIPTLAPGGLWVPAPDVGAHVYKNAQPDQKSRTRKTIKPIVMVAPTEHHPAQVQAISEDVPVGKVITQTWSGMVTSAYKSELLGRLDTLIRAVKQARQRANGQQAEPRQMGDVLFKFIHDGVAA